MTKKSTCTPAADSELLTVSAVRLPASRSRIPVRGFTLVETLVAIAILMIAITAPFFMLQQAIAAAYAARDNLIASSLAQEALEHIYFVRNTNYLAGQPWLQGLAPCQTANGCRVDPTQAVNAVACSAGGCPKLLRAANNLYTYTGAFPETAFTRTIQITTVNAQQVKVTVTMNWTTGNRPYSITVTQDLYSWL